MARYCDPDANVQSGERFAEQSMLNTPLPRLSTDSIGGLSSPTVNWNHTRLRLQNLVFCGANACSDRKVMQLAGLCTDAAPLGPGRPTSSPQGASRPLQNPDRPIEGQDFVAPTPGHQEQANRRCHMDRRQPLGGRDLERLPEPVQLLARTRHNNRLAATTIYNILYLRSFCFRRFSSVGVSQAN